MISSSNQQQSGNYLALDVGAARIGVAVASVEARIPRPLPCITNDHTVFEQIQKLISDQNATIVVLGLPRGMNGQETDQTAVVRAFATELQKRSPVQLYWQDEAVTSKQAESELIARGRPYKKGDIDSLAACYILEDFLHTKEHTAV